MKSLNDLAEWTQKLCDHLASRETRGLNKFIEFASLKNPTQSLRKVAGSDDFRISSILVSVKELADALNEFGRIKTDGEVREDSADLYQLIAILQEMRKSVFILTSNLGYSLSHQEIRKFAGLLTRIILLLRERINDMSDLEKL